MPEVIIYSKTVCPYCIKAKRLFTSRGIPFTEVSIEGEPEIREEMIRLAGGAMTVPQIFINKKHIGGCDDLYALDKRQELDPLLV